MSESKRPPQRATMQDVARLAGVSQPTVSRILRATPTSAVFSEETRSRVLAAAQTLNYRPNTIAQSLRTQRTHMIGLLIPDISHAFWHPLARAVQDVACQQGYDVLMFNSDGLYANEQSFCDAASRRAVDGVIMGLMHLTADEIRSFGDETCISMSILGHYNRIPGVDIVRFGATEALAYSRKIGLKLAALLFERIERPHLPDRLFDLNNKNDCL